MEFDVDDLRGLIESAEIAHPEDDNLLVLGIHSVPPPFHSEAKSELRPFLIAKAGARKLAYLLLLHSGDQS